MVLFIDYVLLNAFYFFNVSSSVVI